MEVMQRVHALDVHLLEDVQSLLDRISGVGNPPPTCCSRCLKCLCGCCCCCTGWSRLLRLGVIANIAPYICFFVLYSLLVTYYAEQQEWEVVWTAVKQDAIYYPAVILAFLLCFRASGCIDRYNDGMRAVQTMEAALRDVSFEVMTQLGMQTAAQDDEDQPTFRLKKRYFQHEFRRLHRLLFSCAARDLLNSALDGAEHEDDQAEDLPILATKVEIAAVLLTGSSSGHAFRVYLVTSWLLNLVKGADEAKFFDQPDVVPKSVARNLERFKAAWLDARQIAFTSMPGTVTYTLWWLTTVMSLFMPWEWVSICQWSTWFPSVLLTISFYGILDIANSMENPFGFDTHDVQLSQVGRSLDEEVLLSMQYSLLDEVAGENLFRAAIGTSMLFPNEDGLDVSALDRWLKSRMLGRPEGPSLNPWTTVTSVAAPSSPEYHTPGGGLW